MCHARVADRGCEAEPVGGGGIPRKGDPGITTAGLAWFVIRSLGCDVEA
ncbi:hypothetical protein [Streptomyces sp. NPDC057238]